MNVMITGAANGIGSDLARVFFQKSNAILHLVDIDAEGLHELQAELQENRVVTYQQDLSDINGLPKLIQNFMKNANSLDVLINNAGIMFLQSLATTPWEKAEKLLVLDLHVPLRLMQLSIPLMKNGGGHIINVSSMAGVTPITGSAFYSAAKAGLSIASEIVRNELKDDSIHVTTVYPGPIATNLESEVRRQIENNLSSQILPTGNSKELAELIFKAYETKDRTLVYPGAYSLFKDFPLATSFFAEHFSPKTKK